MSVRLMVLLAVILLAATGTAADDPTREALIGAVGIAPAGGQRGQADTVGFVTTAAQMDEVVAQSQALAAPNLDALRERLGWSAETALSAAVCPHDDYYYAARLYSLLMPHLRAKTVILIGVFHKARVFECRDQLVFDSFEHWRGPYGPVAVSPLRGELLARLAPGEYVVDNDMHVVEHSIEAIVPWLQAFNRDVSIVPILVPYMDWATMDNLAASLSDALVDIMEGNGWQLGADVAIVVSADAVHYGDTGWGGRSYADFGVDADGYQRAVAHDVGLVESLLVGGVRRSSLKEFLYTCVDREDVTEYTLTWCGRFSIPFGLNVATRVSEAVHGRTLVGTLLDYGTSVGEASLDLESIAGLGTTAPNNLRHWVGYASIGYRQEP